MNIDEKVVTWLIRLDAAFLMLAIPTIFLPVGAMEAVHRSLGMGDFPDQPVTIYLARSCSTLYGMHGVILMLIGIAPRRHWSLIGPIALLHIGLGAVVFVTDLTAGMPWFWTAAEGIPVMLLGVVVYWFWRRADRPRHLKDGKTAAESTL